jgi:hypothetical protein
MRLRASTTLRRRRYTGFTLLETTVAMGVASLMFAGIAAFTVYTARSFVALGNYADLDQASRNSLDVLTRDIRESSALTGFSPNQLTLTAEDNQPLVYQYNPSTSTLTRRKGSEVTVLLEQCDYLKFSVFQRSPSNNFMFYPVQSNRWDLAKLVDVSWICSRKILGAKVNTESVQTAKIVMRN